jgi:aminotransferase
MSGSALTSYQESNLVTEYDDLTVGYPRLRTNSQQLYSFRTFVRNFHQAPESRNESLQKLRTAIRKLLGAGSDLRCEITFSGSVALERTISAVAPHNRATLVTTPGFDAIYSFVERSTSRRVRYVELDPFASRSEAIDSILENVDVSVGAVILVSPNNPSGLTLSAAELQKVADACSAVDAVLVVDQCFLLVNPRDVNAGAAFDLGDRCRWVGLWDSSKTVELLGEKFGAIFGSREELSRVGSLLKEIQFELPIPTLMVMRAALEELSDGSELRSRNKLIKQNYIDLRAVCQDIGLKVNCPDAGAFALICIEDWTGGDSMLLAERLLREHRISVVPSRLLYPQDYSAGRDFLRVSLVRPKELLGRLCNALSALSGSSPGGL